jgi:hypothetical protein
MRSRRATPELHLPDGEEILDQDLDALVNIAVVEDAPQAIEHGV